MKRVRIAELKARLSAHLRAVRRGEEVLVLDRDQPVARIVPVPQDLSEHERRLIARGVLTPPKRRRRPGERLPNPPGNVSREVMAALWEEERDGR